MIPSTWTGLLVVLMCLMPGALWELKRARHEPSVREDSLLNLARILLVSFLAVLPAGLVIVLVAWVMAASVPPRSRSSVSVLVAWLNAPLSAYALPIAAATLACSLVYLAARCKWKTSKGSFPPGSTWYQSLVAHPAESPSPLLIVELQDGTTWRGTFWGFDSDPDEDHRSLLLREPIWRKRAHAADFVRRDKMQAVLLPEAQISSIQIKYRPAGSTEVSLAESVPDKGLPRWGG